MRTQFRLLDYFVAFWIVMLSIAFLSSYSTLTIRINNLSEIVDLKEKEIHELKINNRINQFSVVTQLMESVEDLKKQDNHLGDKIAGLEGIIDVLLIDRERHRKKIVSLEKSLEEYTLRSTREYAQTKRDWKYNFGLLHDNQDRIHNIELALQAWDIWWFEYEPGIVRKN